MSSTLTAADDLRLRTWLSQIVGVLRPELLPGRSTGSDIRFGKSDGLAINKKKGAWRDFSSDKGGYSAIPLIALLRNCSIDDALVWGRAWLAAHDGEGCNIADDADELEDGVETYASSKTAQESTAKAVDIINTPGHEYLKSRGIELTSPAPADLAWLPDARIGEGAVIGLLRSHGRVVGIQRIHIDPFGRKSLIRPVKQRFSTERAPDAVFEVYPTPAQGVTDFVTKADLIIVEGLENALSIASLNRPVRVIGMPGVWVLKHLPVVKGQRVIVVKDGKDDADSPAARTAIAGVDHLLLGGAEVRVTETPSGQDANSILQEQGPGALLDLIKAAKTGGLSRDGRIEQLARLKELEFETQRQQAAKDLNIPVGILRREVAKRRQKPTKADPNPEKSARFKDDPPWEGQVDISAALDAAVTQIRRYVIATPAQYYVMAVWSALTHLVHNDAVDLQIMPRLAFQARTPESGKTVSLDVVRHLSRRGILASSLTSSVAFRVIDSHRPTLFINEADQIPRDDPMWPILNSSHRRAEAFVWRSEPTPEGSWEPTEFSTWGAVAFACIDELPRTQQTRNIVIELRKALAEEKPEHLIQKGINDLIEIRRQFAAFANSLECLPEPELPPSLFNRAGDNWAPMIALAEMASADWGARIRAAAAESTRRESRPSILERLLAGVRQAFDKQEKHDLRAHQEAAARGGDYIAEDFPDSAFRLTTKTLLGRLLADEEEEWGQLNSGRPITSYWLRDQLRGAILQPPGAQKWEVGGRHSASRTHCRGYYRAQFEAAWAANLKPTVENPQFLEEGVDVLLNVHDSEDAGASAGHAGESGRDITSQTIEKYANTVITTGTGPADAFSQPQEKSALLNQYSASFSGGSGGSGGSPEVPPSLSVADSRANPTTSNPPIQPNGAVINEAAPGGSAWLQGRPPSAITAEIRQERAQHPDWSIERLSKKLGHTKSRILRALNEGGVSNNSEGSSP